jgi:chitin biosynthesis protein CHS5
MHSPLPPTLRLRGATQTSLVLEWDPIQLATSKLRSLSLYRNGSKAGIIPRPKEMLSTKISGLAVDTEYSFYLVLRTTGGTFSSPVLTCRTHKMTDLSGITVTPGVLPEQLRASLETALDRIGARIADTVRIDTTHFVCTEGRGKDWERALEMNIPVVRPEWVEGCEREGRIVGVRGYYLDANPKQRHVGQNPSLSNATAGSSSVAMDAKGSQAYVPERSAGRPPPLASSDREIHITGEGNGPGPEVPPTPPPKMDSRRSPMSTEAARDDDDEGGQGAGESENEASPVSPLSGGSPPKGGKRSEASMKARVEDGREEEGIDHAGMDDVSL